MIVSWALEADRLQLCEKEQDLDAKAEAYVIHAIIDGHTIREIAEVGGISRPQVYEWCRLSPERKRLISIARERSAESLVDDALEILDTADGRESSIASARANFRKWLATVRDRSTYGDQKPQAISISFNSLHLDAMKMSKVAQPYASPSLPSGDITVHDPIVQLDLQPEQDVEVIPLSIDDLM